MANELRAGQYLRDYARSIQHSGNFDESTLEANFGSLIIGPAISIVGTLIDVVPHAVFSYNRSASRLIEQLNNVLEVNRLFDPLQLIHDFLKIDEDFEGQDHSKKYGGSMDHTGSWTKGNDKTQVLWSYNHNPKGDFLWIASGKPNPNADEIISFDYVYGDSKLFDKGKIIEHRLTTHNFLRGPIIDVKLQIIEKQRKPTGNVITTNDSTANNNTDTLTWINSLKESLTPEILSQLKGLN